MHAFLLALAIAAAPEPSTAAAPSPAQPAPATATPAAGEPAVQPTGIAPGTNLGAVNAGAAPTDDFGFVAWCAGAVQGYLRLKPDLMPEVRRIETQFRRPGSSLAEDMKDYADMEKEARRQMGLYQRAIQAAEKASPTSISDQGQAAYNRGLAVWAAPAGSSKARIAQEWMSWALPARCETTAKTLTTKASLFGAALKPSADAGSTAEPATEAQTPADAAAEARSPETPSSDAAPADAAAPSVAPAPTPKAGVSKARKPKTKAPKG